MPRKPLPVRAEPATPLDAGRLGAWLTGFRTALATGAASDVPCGTCTGCCTSGVFVHIAPDETDALSHIPPALLFPAPRLPQGHVLMGYDERGRCPMLGDQGCSIYAHRPRTCRTYDCRVFSAAGLEPEDDKPAVAERVRRWHFDHAGEGERVTHEAITAAAGLLRERATELPEGSVPSTTTHLAVAAVDIHELFLATDATGRLQAVEPAVDKVASELVRRLAR